MRCGGAGGSAAEQSLTPQTRLCNRVAPDVADRLHERANRQRRPEEQPRRDPVVGGAHVRLGLDLRAVPECCRCWRRLRWCRAVAAKLGGAGNTPMSASRKVEWREWVVLRQLGDQAVPGQQASLADSPLALYGMRRRTLSDCARLRSKAAPSPRQALPCMQASPLGRSPASRSSMAVVSGECA